MNINRQDIEIIVQTIIDERVQHLIECMKSNAYYERDHGGALEYAKATIYDALAGALQDNIEEAKP